MIEVNLLPGSPKRSRRLAKAAGSKLLRLPGPANLDRWVVLPALGWVVAVALVGWLFTSTHLRQQELDGQIEAAVKDSARYAVLARQDSLLGARRDTIAQKLQIIQQIDAGRYVWAHIMDEVSRNLPAYTWVVGISDVADDTPTTVPEFRVSGRAGNPFALTEFVRNLEASSFIRDVTIESTEQIKENDRLVYAFLLTARYEEPPADMIETVPLFTREGED